MNRTQTITIGVISNTKIRELILSGLLILIPLTLSGPQLLVGSIVNLLLLLSAATSQSKTWWIKAAIPSLAAITHGVLFGFFTPYLLYLWPVITLGNWLYMRLSKNKLILAIITKTLVLWLGTLLLSQFKIVPQLIVSNMGVVQLVTATIGGLGATIFIIKLSKDE